MLNMSASEHQYSHENEASLATSAQVALSETENTATTIEPSKTPTEKIEPVQTAPQGSTFFTKLMYGAAALGGKSRGTIFLELYNNGTLKADLLINAKLAEDRLRDAAEERCKQRNLNNPANQSKLFTIFTSQKALATATNKPYKLDQQRADEYNPLLGDALQAIIIHHATVVQPELDQKRIAEKAAADAAYEKEMKEVHLAFAAHAASNKRDIDEQASTQTHCDIQQEKHFIDIAAYENLLQVTREQNTKK